MEMFERKGANKRSPAGSKYYMRLFSRLSEIILLILIVAAVECHNKEATCQRSLPQFTNLIKSLPAIAALKKYQHFHNRILDQVNVPVDLHHYINHQSDISVRYLIYVASPEAGLGNRLLGLISSFLLALLTNRILLVDFYDYDIDDLVCNEFIRWSLPKTVNWSLIQRRVRQGYVNAADVASVAGVDGFVKTASVDGFVKMATLSLDLQNNRNRQLLASSELSKLWINVQILKVCSIIYFVPLLFANPHYAPLLLHWFPDLDVAHPLARLMLQPIDSVWKQFQHTLAMQSSSQKSIGLQFRSFNGKYNETQINTLINCADSLSPSQVFIASLHPEISPYLNSHRPWRVIHRFAEQRQIKGLKQARTALHDIWMLSECDDLIITGRSTLGYIAMALRRSSRDGTVLALKSDQVISGCSVITSNEPCMHGTIDWGLVQRKDQIHVKNDNDHFIYCEDTIGIKLNRSKQQTMSEKEEF